MNAEGWIIEVILGCCMAAELYVLVGLLLMLRGNRPREGDE